MTEQVLEENQIFICSFAQKILKSLEFSLREAAKRFLFFKHKTMSEKILIWKIFSY